MNLLIGSKTFKFLCKTIILSAMLVMLLIVTGMMPYLINLGTAIFTGNMQVAIRYGFGVFGFVVGFMVAILVLIIGLAPILILLAFVYSQWKRRRSENNE